MAWPTVSQSREIVLISASECGYESKFLMKITTHDLITLQKVDWIILDDLFLTSLYSSGIVPDFFEGVGWYSHL